MFNNGKKDNADSGDFVAPKNVPAAPAPKPQPQPQDTGPAPETPIDKPVQLPDAANPDALFAPDKGDAFKAPQN